MKILRKNLGNLSKMKLLRFLPIVPILFCAGCKKTEKTNAEEYLEILQESKAEQDFHTQLYIFPESIEGLEIKAFYYAHMEDLFTGSFLLYIVLGYQEENFITELERLSKVEAVFNQGTKQIIHYSEERMYLTVKQNARFEYVMYNETTFEIAYVSNQIFEWKDTPVDSQYVIPEVTIPTELDDRDNMYNLYYWYEGDVGIYVND